MPLNREAKAAVISEVSAQVNDAGAIVLAQYRGLDVDKLTALRKQARDNGVFLRVLKNTLVARAIDGTSFADLKPSLAGPLIYGIAKDPVMPAKILCDFAKQNPDLVIQGGAMPHIVMDAAAINALASLPSREVLLATLLGTLQAPITSFVRTLNEVPSKFVRALAAIHDQKATA